MLFLGKMILFGIIFARAINSKNSRDCITVAVGLADFKEEACHP